MKLPTKSNSQGDTAIWVRRNLGFFLILLIICCGAILVGISMLARSLEPRQQQPNMGSKAIPTELRGKDLEVPSGQGHWFFDTTPNSHVLIHRSMKTGYSRKINLCSQRKFRPDLPNQIYPIFVFNDWDALERQQKNSRQMKFPIVVSDDASTNMPNFSIEGDYKGKISVKINQPKTELWSLVMADQPDNNIKEDGEVWLLWNETTKKSSTNLKLGMKEYSNAIRIRRLKDSPLQFPENCNERTEQIELQMYSESDAGIAANDNALASVLIKTSNESLSQFSLPSGTHKLLFNPSQKLEDKALFDNAMQLGLIRFKNGFIEWAPQDLVSARLQGMPVDTWDKVDVTQTAIQKTLKALHHTANGQFVQSQLRQFNAMNRWAALRIRAEKSESRTQLTMNKAWSNLQNWSATTNNQNLMLSNQMPEVTMRLFQQLPQGWGDWIRVINVPNWNLRSTIEDGLHMRVKVPAPATVGNIVEVMTLGKMVGLSGGKLISSIAACSSNSCPSQDFLTIHKVQLTQTEVTFSLSPDERFARLNPVGSEGLKVTARDGKLSWIDEGPTTKKLQSDVTLFARDNTLLFANGQPTEKAEQLGLVELLGVSQLQSSGVAGVLSRLGGSGETITEATLTIDPKLAEVSEMVLDCVGFKQGEWDSKTRTCRNSSEKIISPPERIASLVFLDSENGDILTAAKAPHIPMDVKPADLIAHERFMPRSSPLQFTPFHHDGGIRFSPGSTIKIHGALSLEKWAENNPLRQRMLDGQSVDEWNVIGKDFGFDMQSACFPMPCKTNFIRNFGNKSTTHAIHSPIFGMEKAIEKSANNWFAFMIEKSDTTAQINPSVQGLGNRSLEKARPFLFMAHRLGFENELRLDGGLLPQTFPWRSDDNLVVIPSSFDNVENKHMIHLQAIGQRMQVTPLKMAQISAAVATGNIVEPRLLLRLNEIQSIPKPFQRLGVELSRVRRGMKAVIESGTASGNFTSSKFDSVRTKIFGKTGTANMCDRTLPQTQKSTSSTENINLKSMCDRYDDLKPDDRPLKVVWFVGYIEAGTFPEQKNTIAFAVSISNSDSLGGSHAARVISSIIETMIQR